jgi:phage terminase Nu1 subunit (DNA packaging protein)
MEGKTVTVTELCRLLAGVDHEPLTRMAITQFVADGMPKAARGKYDETACMHWYIGRLRDSTKRKESENPDGSLTSLEDERKRLTAAQANLGELDLAERTGKLIPLEIYETRIATFVATTKTALLNLPARLAGRVEGMSKAEAKAFIGAAVRACLSELAANGKPIPQRPQRKADTAMSARPKRGAKPAGGRKPRSR